MCQEDWLSEPMSLGSDPLGSFPLAGTGRPGKSAFGAFCCVRFLSSLPFAFVGAPAESHVPNRHGHPVLL
jgi:hypothetical protein